MTSVLFQWNRFGTKENSRLKRLKEQGSERSFMLKGKEEWFEFLRDERISLLDLSKY